jgi:hypothetical protein
MVNNPSQLQSIVWKIKKGNRTRLIEVIKDFRIRDPKDFAKYSVSDIRNRKNIGDGFVLELRRVLAEMNIFLRPKSLPDSLIDERKMIDVALQKFKSKKRTVPSTKLIRLRFEILERDHFRCQYCGRSPRTDLNVILQIDHVIPLAKDGDWSPENLIASCIECNLGKGDIILKSRKEG